MTLDQKFKLKNVSKIKFYGQILKAKLNKTNLPTKPKQALYLRLDHTYFIEEPCCIWHHWAWLSLNFPFTSRLEWKLAFWLTFMILLLKIQQAGSHHIEIRFMMKSTIYDGGSRQQSQSDQLVFDMIVIRKK
jgi:hypothetical protein